MHALWYAFSIYPSIILNHSANVNEIRKRIKGNLKNVSKVFIFQTYKMTSITMLMILHEKFCVQNWLR